MKLALLLTALLFAGCAAHERLPGVRWNDFDDARQILLRRAREVRTVTAQGLMTLQRPDGQSVRFDVALVRDAGQRMRLRAWKLGRAVFDLTLTPDGLWLLAPDDPSLRQRVRDAGTGIRRVAESWRLLNGDFFARSDLVARETGSILEYSARTETGTMWCDVDRRTLTPRRYLLADPRGATRFSLEISGYRMLGQIPFACRYVASSDMGRITIALREVELNSELAPAAFVPPPRAQKVQ